MTDDLRCNAKLFADDTSLFTIVHDPNAAASDINHDLDILKAWATKWRMSFNPDPNKQAVELTFSTKRVKTDQPDILFGGVPVVKVEEHKQLGLILDPKLSFASHIKTAIAKSRQGIGSKYLPRHNKDRFCKTTASVAFVDT